MLYFIIIIMFSASYGSNKQGFLPGVISNLTKVANSCNSSLKPPLKPKTDEEKRKELEHLANGSKVESVLFLTHHMPRHEQYILEFLRSKGSSKMPVVAIKHRSNSRFYKDPKLSGQISVVRSSDLGDYNESLDNKKPQLIINAETIYLAGGEADFNLANTIHLAVQSSLKDRDIVTVVLLSQTIYDENYSSLAEVIKKWINVKDYTRRIIEPLFYDIDHFRSEFKFESQESETKLTFKHIKNNKRVRLLLVID